ncbi:MAG: hypothetical protein KAS23_04390 [Anaerohalosphaera sp.]|nr:hypothetical protein [Anaerohalosphaera sp.]
MINNEVEEYRQKTKDEILNNYIPYYQQWIDCCVKYTKIPAFTVPLVFSAIPYLLGLVFLIVLGVNPEDYSKFWLRLNLSGMIAGMFYFMSYIYSRTVESLDDFLFVLKSKQHIDTLKDSYRLVFKSPLQLVNCAIWGLLMTSTELAMGVPLSMPGTIYICVSSLVVGFLLGSGLWYTITISILIRRFCGIQEIRLNIFDPSRTVGIRELSNLLSVWGICLVLEALLVLLGLFGANWSHGEAIIDFLHLFWTAFIFFVVMFVFMYPHYEIKKIIAMGKKKGAKKYQDHIEGFMSKFGNHSIDELEKLEKEIGILSKYHNIYISIIKSPSMAIDISVIWKFISAMTVPMAIAIIERPQFFSDIYEFAKNLLS